jgi:hypothetical protein
MMKVRQWERYVDSPLFPAGLLLQKPPFDKPFWLQQDGGYRSVCETETETETETQDIQNAYRDLEPWSRRNGPSFCRRRLDVT